MSSSIVDTNNSNSIILSKVVIATYQELDIPDNIEQVILEPNVPEPEGFNYVLQNNKAQIFGFLSRYDSFADKNSLTKILKVFEIYPFVNYVYGDAIIVGEGFRQEQFLPSSLINTQIIQTPIFVKKVNRPFNTLKITTFFDDMLKDLATWSVGNHIAEFLFITKKHKITPELEIPNG